MHGNRQLTFIELFADTVNTHGAGWAHKHYAKNRMADWEFGVWLKAARSTGRI